MTFSPIIYWLKNPQTTIIDKTIVIVIPLFKIAICQPGQFLLHPLPQGNVGIHSYFLIFSFATLIMEEGVAVYLNIKDIKQFCFCFNLFTTCSVSSTFIAYCKLISMILLSLIHYFHYIKARSMKNYMQYPKWIQQVVRAKLEPRSKSIALITEQYCFH